MVETGGRTPMTPGACSSSGIGATLLSFVLVSCTSQPISEPELGTTTDQNAAASVFIDVPPSLREAVRKAASRYPSLSKSAIGTTPASAEYTIHMVFSSQVDRKRQMSNRDGAVPGGLLSFVVGSITPWPCLTRHQLSASVSRSDGTQLTQESIQEEENRVGTMFYCPDVTEPSEGLAEKMANTLFHKLVDDGVFTRNQ